MLFVMRSNDFIDASMLTLANFCRSSKFWNMRNLLELRPVPLRAERGLLAFRPVALRADRGIVVTFERSLDPAFCGRLIAAAATTFQEKFYVAWSLLLPSEWEAHKALLRCAERAPSIASDVDLRGRNGVVVGAHHRPGRP